MRYRGKSSNKRLKRGVQRELEINWLVNRFKNPRVCRIEKYVKKVHAWMALPGAWRRPYVQREYF